MKMIFPILNISEKTWNSDDLTDYILFDKFIYTDRESIFYELYKNKFLIKIIKINNKLNFARCTLGSLFVTKKFCRIIKKNLKIYN